MTRQTREHSETRSRARARLRTFLQKTLNTPGMNQTKDHFVLKNGENESEAIIFKTNLNHDIHAYARTQNCTHLAFHFVISNIVKFVGLIKKGI